MFKRVLLCYDGSEVGRRALKRGAELAILVGAQVYVLSIVPSGVADAAIVAGAAGHACLVDEAGGYRKLLDESIEWLKSRGCRCRRIPGERQYHRADHRILAAAGDRSHRAGPLSPALGRLLVGQLASDLPGRARQLLRVRRRECGG